jgi:hypothetical protein
LADEDFLYDKFAVLRDRIKESHCIISTKHPEAVFLQTIIFFQLVRIPLKPIFNNYTATSAEFLHVIPYMSFSSFLLDLIIIMCGGGIIFLWHLTGLF